MRRPALKISRVVAEEVARTGTPLITTNAQADARLSNSRSVEGMKLRSVMCLPLSARGRFLGFLYLDHRFEEGAFRPEQLEILGAFANQAAVALENARLVAELMHPRLAGVVLAHLSAECNRPALARQAVGDALAKAGWQGHLDVASQHRPTALLDLEKLRYQAGPSQLSFL